MPLVPTQHLVDMAERENFALPAFNAPHLEFMMWVLEEAEHKRSPVIIQIAPVEYHFLDINALAEGLKALSYRFSIPFSLHLDHAHSYKEVVEAIQSGFSSVMIDASRHPFEHNVKLTRQVADTAHLVNLMVEGEIGRVGGLEGDESWEVEGDEEDYFTSSREGLRFVRETGVDLLAVAVGTRHGVYTSGPPSLHFDRIREIREATGKPLVLHGGSGTPVYQLQQASNFGVRKVNFSTTLRVAYLRGFNEYYAAHPQEVFLPKMMREASPMVKVTISECLTSVNSEGKA